MHVPPERVAEPLADQLPRTPEAVAAERTSRMALARVLKAGVVWLIIPVLIFRPAADAGLWPGLDFVGPIVLVISVWLVSDLWRRRTVRRIVEARGVACPWCTYDLDTQPHECVCPECGHSVNQGAARAAWDVIDPMADATCRMLQWRTIRRALALAALPFAAVVAVVLIRNDNAFFAWIVAAISCWLSALFVLQHDRERVYARGVARRGRVCPRCLTDLRDSDTALTPCPGCGRSWRVGSVVAGWARFADLRHRKVL